MVKENDLVTFQATQSIIQVLMMMKGVVPAPQTSSFTPKAVDLSAKFAEWGLPLNESVQPIQMVTKDEAEILNQIKANVEAQLTKTQVPETDKQAAAAAAL